MKPRTKMRDDISLSRSFRTKAIEALQAAAGGSGSHAALLEAAEEAENAIGGRTPGDPVWAYGLLLRGLASAVQWEPAIAAADMNPARFRDSARHFATTVLASKGELTNPANLVEVASKLEQMATTAEVRGCAELLLRCPLPVRVTDIARPATPKAEHEPASSPRPDASPVLALLSLDGQAIHVPMTIHPDRVYRLGIATRTMKWPEEAARLEIDFVSVLRPSILELKGVHFEKTPASEETVLQLRGSLSPLDRGHDIALRAAYLMKDGGYLPVRVVGHPKLRLKTFDAATALPKALPMVASKLQDMIGVLETKLPGLLAADREDLFVLLESLLRFADRAMQEKVLSGGDRLSEAAFQQELKRHFRADPNIGARLQEKASQAGGITDLGLGRVVLELKVEHDRPVSMTDAHQYMSQPAHYASSKDCPVSVLCILDDSEKHGPPGIPANYVDWLFPALHGLADPRYPSLVATVLVPIRFPTPSTWSE